MSASHQERRRSVPHVPDDRQRLVIEAGAEERLIVVAGPGTGKTQVAAMRLVHLLREGLQPAQILVLSFSRSAVATLSRRLVGLHLDDAGLVEELRHLAVRTFDSWAFRMLRQSGVPASELLCGSHDANISRLTRMLEDGDAPLLERLAHIRHVIADEFQDLPGVRAEMVTALLARLTSTPRSRLGFTVLGDPIQAIFRFAARSKGQPAPADPWIDLRQRVGNSIREIELTKNYRSTAELSGMAASLRKILGSQDLDPERKLAAMTRFLSRLPSSREDARLSDEWLAQLPEGSVAILTRTNGEALRVWQMLLGKALEAPSASVSLRLAGGTPKAPAWIAALLSRYRFPTITRDVFARAYAKTSGDLGPESCAALGLPVEEVAWRRLLRASGASDMATVVDTAALRGRLDWPDSFPDDHSIDSAAVCITTVHQAKGMEFDNVALLDQRERRDAEPPVDPLEAAHVGFVAVTRAGRHLGRLPPACIYEPPTKREFRGGRVRQVLWRKMVNVQMGLPGDVDPLSFVDADIHGGEAGVKDLQQSLLSNARLWRGRRVALRKVDTAQDSARARDVRYEIRIQEEDGPGQLIGRTCWQLTEDLLDLLWGPGYTLPRDIYNLRIAEIITTCEAGDIPSSVPEPWRTSRLWLGVVLIGTGDFKTWRRNGG